MKVGFFDNAKREYVMTTPVLPVRWINYIGTLAFGGFVDHTGGGVICKKDPALNRITKYIMQLPLSAMNGETCYIRIKNETSHAIFSPFYTPTLTPYDKYECHVGFSYSRFIYEAFGLHVEVIVFVPDKHPRVIRKISVTNTGKKTLEVDVIPVVEYSHFDALKDLTNADWVPQTMQSRLIKGPKNNKIVTQFAYLNLEYDRNFFTSSLPFSSFETSRNLFLGNYGYGTWQNPLSLQLAELSNTEVNRGENICALMNHLGRIAPGETKILITQLGQTDDIPGEWEKINYYNDVEHVDEALKDISHFWDEYLSALQVETPDEAMNTMLNIHHPRQCFITFNWSRDLSLYQLGFGGRGHGFRDSAQDSLGVLANAPQRARGLIEELLQVQCRDGHAMHQFYPLTMEANAGDSRSHPDRPTYYSDDHLWIILAVTGYLKETGDMKFLEKVLPFYEKNINKKIIEKGTVLEHLARAICFTQDNTGVHGLPLLGFADWNDTVNLQEGAESVFTACLYGKALLEMIELFQFLEKEDEATKLTHQYEKMKERVNEHCWDGEWFVRYFTKEGEPLGSKKSPGSQIYINAQSWAILSGFAPPERAARAIASVHEKLSTEYGYKLSSPSFKRYDERYGGVSTYPPGAKENGGIFLHTNPWVIIAETMLGYGDDAFETYTKINPVTKNDSIEKYEIEPYCYAQNILGDEHPEHGKARNSWLSGTASWVYQAAVQYILGIRPGYSGLLFDPCIPKVWKKYKAVRKYRGAVYKIEVENPNSVNRGVKKIYVNGAEITGNIIPFGKPDEVLTIKVQLS